MTSGGRCTQGMHTKVFFLFSFFFRVSRSLRIQTRGRRSQRKRCSKFVGASHEDKEETLQGRNGGLLSQNGLNAQGAWATDGWANPPDHPTSFPLFTWIYLTGAGYFSFLLFAAGVNKLRRHTAGGRLSRIPSSGGRTLSEKTFFILLQLYSF